jgi:hypothetical protein
MFSPQVRILSKTCSIVIFAINRHPLALFAAHCLFDGGTFRAPSHVLIGGVEIGPLSNFAEVIPVSQAFYPTQYRPGVVESNYDVGVLKLSKATVAPPVTLSTSAPAAGTSIISLGWGKTELSDSGVKDLRLK